MKRSGQLSIPQLMMIIRLVAGFQGVLIGFLSIIGMLAVEAATIQGQVTDKDTGVQIEGATITLHAAPGNGPAVQTESSNLFGLYRFDDASDGSWVIKATRQGYSDATAEVSLSSEPATANIALERKDGLPGSTVELITITTVVVDAKSNYPIPNLPVTLFRYDDAADTTPDTVSAITDANGSAEVRVTEPGGFNDFAVNQNGRSG